MPDRDVHTIRDLIYYQYAKIIACNAFKVADGQQAKKLHYGFIKNTFRDLKSGGKSWSHIEREDWQLVKAEKKLTMPSQVLLTCQIFLSCVNC